MTEPLNRPPRKTPGTKETSAQKTARIPIKIVPQAPMRKPEWIRMKVPDSSRFQEIKQVLRDNNLYTVCEEASCPNIGECFSGGTATFMILGDICTRRCPFCDVGHGKPLPPDVDELALAGGLQGAPVQLIKCKTVDLEVPATAEIVLGESHAHTFTRSKDGTTPWEELQIRAR